MRQALWLSWRRWLAGVVICTAVVMAAPLNAATLYVVNHGWHTGIVIRRGDIAPGVWPEHRQAPPGELLEIGWGEREFYQARDPGLWLAARAAFWPQASVLHLVGFNGPVAERFAYSEIVSIEVDADAISRLAQHISDAYERDAAGKIMRLGRGLYGDSRFFAAREKFYLFNTCNVWTGRAISIAGCPVGAGITASNVMTHAAKCLAP